jgi:hypothetical protein
MAQTKIYGYLLSLKIGTKLIVGLETTGLKLKPNFEEVCLKEQAGVPVDDFIDFDTEMSISGKAIERDSGQSSTHEDFETLREASALGAEAAFVYGRFVSGEKIVSGTLTLRDWSEDAGSKKEMANWSGSAKAKKGSVTFTTFTA